MSYISCPCCNAKRGLEDVNGPGMVRTCKCGAIFGDCYLGDSYGIVSPHMTTRNVPPEETRYFDFTCVSDSQGVVRRHGWYEPTTKLIVQVG